MKPINNIKDDVQVGDLVKLFFSGEENTYVGYCWCKSRKDFDETNIPAFENKPDVPVYGLHNADLFLCPLNPIGIDKQLSGEFDDFGLEYKIQMLGVNTHKGTVGDNIPLIGYKILIKDSTK